MAFLHLGAMDCGVPVVTTDCGGVREFVLDGYNCLLAEPGDIGGLANRVVQLIDDADRRAYLSANARKTALSFSEKKAIPKWEEYLRQLQASLEEAKK